MTSNTPQTQSDPRPGYGLVPVISWAFYDFANTIFSFAIATKYFNVWIVDERHGEDWFLAAMGVCVTVALVATMPILGAMADVFGRRKPFLIACTALSVIATLALSRVDSTVLALVIGGIAIFGFQSALAHYDPLLAEVAPPEHRGRVSGLGVGLGYVGVLVALVVLGVLVGKGSAQNAFVPTALLYAFFALPCFIFVRERGRRHAERRRISALTGAAFRQLGVTLRNVRENRDVFRLLMGRFLYVDALAVLITYMAIYIDRVGGFDGALGQVVLGVSISSAAVGAFVAGRVVERTGPRRVLLTVITAVVFGLVLASGTGARWALWITGPLIGIGLGAVWTSDRVFMMRLSPPAARGEYFSIYNLVGKVGGAIGPVIWGGTVKYAHDVMHWSLLDSSRLAIAVLAIPAIIGALIIRNLDDSTREWGSDPLEHELEELQA